VSDANPARATISVAARFGLGVALPAALLAAWILLVVLTGGGREWAPVIAMVGAFVALPLALLLDCWVLFVDWRSHARLAFAGLILPALVGAGIAAFVHGSGAVHRAGAIVVVPFLAAGKAAGHAPLVAFVIWGVALSGVILAARARSAARHAPADLR
jgi:hypothetical protein